MYYDSQTPLSIVIRQLAKSNPLITWLISKWKESYAAEYRLALIDMNCLLYARPVEFNTEDFVLASPPPNGDIIDEFIIKGSRLEISYDGETLIDYNYIITVYYCSPNIANSNYEGHL